MTGTTPSLPLVAVYADESCLGNGREGANPGGAAGLIEYWNPGTGTLTRWDYWIAEPATTNNRMALRSAIDALRLLSAKGRAMRIVFTSDSQYLVKGMEEWVHGWIQRGWRRAGGAIENLELWRELAELSRQHQCQWRWVRGHDGHPQNEYANMLAIRAAQQQSSSDGRVESQFEAWLDRERARGRITVAPDPFPDPAGFRAARPLPSTAAGRPK